MRKVNELLREVLSEAVLELKDPRIGFVTITGVRDVGRTCATRRVYVSVLGSERKRERSLEGLAAAHGVLQARVGARGAVEADADTDVRVRPDSRARACGCQS